MFPNPERLELWGGIECTINRVGDRYGSQLVRNGHQKRPGDLERIAGLGIRTLRYPLLWEMFAPEERGKIDWSWADERMAKLRELGIRPIVGLLHHGSGPRYACLVDPHFPEMLARYARAVAERYPWVDLYTPVNEPLTTARFCGLYGHWYPHGRDMLSFGRALLGQLRGVVLAMRAIREVNPGALLVQTEDLGQIFSTPRLQYQADFENERRWLSFDLLCGRINGASVTRDCLRTAGISDAELAFFQEFPCPPDLMGINRYVTSDRFLDHDCDAYPPQLRGGNGREEYVDVEAVRERREGMADTAELLAETWQRYRRPVAITEAHLSCTREEQVRWLVEQWGAAHRARKSGVPVAAVTAWALLGAFDWNTLLTEMNGHYEVGAFDVRFSPPRETAVAGLLRELAEEGEGETRGTVANGTGWWRRNVRFLPETHPGEFRGRYEVRPTYTPHLKTTRSVPSQPILIAGATGRLGQAFARVCYLRGLPYRLLNRSEMDIADRAAVRRALDSLRPWAVVNAAGYARVDEAERDESRCFRENLSGAERLAEECARAGAALATFSSALVFDGRNSAPYEESDLANPVNVYGRSKSAAEANTAVLHSNLLTIRTSTMFGPWDCEYFVARSFEHLRNGLPFRVADDYIVSPTYIPDVVNTTLDLLIDGERGIWHLANSGAVTRAEFVQRLAEMAGADPTLVEGCPEAGVPGSAPRPRYCALASERATLLPSGEDALARYLRERVDLRQPDAPSPTECAS